MSLTSVVEDIAAAAELEPIDIGFGQLVARLATREHAGVLALTAALVSRERRNGHACADLSRWAGRGIGSENGDASFPDLSAWRGTLRASSLVGNGETITPLVLDASDRCYLFRYWSAERRLAERILAMSADVQDHGDKAREADKHEAESHEADNIDWQAQAARLVLTRRLAIISGGPGTGKTTTVARILALLLTNMRDLRVELAAPTGKAAARLTESIRAQAEQLTVDAELRLIIGGLEARTIHRLLGYGGRSGSFRHDASRPLPCDVVIVDEASMIDLLLMDSLLAAVPPQARLVLVGDKDQLASVDAGFVFGDLCGAAQAPGAHALAGAAVELRKNWRFRDHPGIEALAAAVRGGDGAKAVAALADPSLDDADRIDPPADPRAIVRLLEAEIDAVVTATSALDAIAGLARFRLLCVTNRGPYGVETLNRLIEQHLRERGLAGNGDWYRGRPILITANDYSLDLFNGDVGVCFPDPEGHLRAWFPATGGGLRAIVPANLPPHETAWAMTVHKGQGSEFDRVIVVLPERDSPLLTRELVYTAVTRGRERVTLLGSEATLRAAVERKAARSSGLMARLSGGQPPG